MKRVILLVGVLLCMSVMSHAQLVGSVDWDGKLRIMDGGNLIELSAVVAVMDRKIKAMTPEQRHVLDRVNSILFRMVGEMKEKVSTDKKAFEVAQALSTIAVVNAAILSAHPEGNKDLQAVVMGACSISLHDAFSTLRKEDANLYQDVVYLLKDSRLPKIERDIVQCIDEVEAAK